MRHIDPIAQYYEEYMPAQSRLMRECDRLAEATLARARKIIFEAMKNGHIITLGSCSAGFNFNGAEEHFKGIEIPEKKDLPRFTLQKFRELNQMEATNKP